MPTLTNRIRNAWNAFTSRDPTKDYRRDYGTGYYQRPYHRRMHYGAEKTIISSIYNTISIDVAAVPMRHVRLDKNDRYKEDIKDGLNRCLTLRANTDQTGRDFIQDLVISMCQEGCVAVVPVETFGSPLDGPFDIESIRVSKITQWYPQHVKVSVYNEWKGKQEEIVLPKSAVSIHTNPLYTVMNEPNSTLKRLVRKLALLDIVDENTSSGKLDVIIQLPYVVKTPTQKRQAEERRKDIEMQLVGSKYGIAYTDGTEKVIQLNRSLENNLMTQVEYLTSMLYSQLGITEEILKGTADEKTMLNYNNRIIEPLLSCITDEFKRKFLTPTARTQRQSITFYREPFKLVPVNDLAEIADKFTRNAILSSNELRGLIGFKPVNDPKADELRNKNLNESKQEQAPVVTERDSVPDGTRVQVD